MTTQAIETVKKGTFVRLNGTAKKPRTYILLGYCRMNKAYELQNREDANDYKYVKKGKEVFVGFDY